MRFNPKLIEFFKRHNMYNDRMFEYLQNQSTMIDYNDPEQRCFVGCFPILDKNDKIIKIKLNLPYINNDETMLISIHELTHGIERYQEMGKKYKKDITIEALPLLYEKIYILENPVKELVEYGKYLDSMIDEKCAKEYRFGLKIREELLKQYNNNFKQMAKLTKKLAKKHQKDYQ